MPLDEQLLDALPEYRRLCKARDDASRAVQAYLGRLTAEAQRVIESESGSAVQRGRGRPPGSPNKAPRKPRGAAPNGGDAHEAAASDG